MQLEMFIDEYTQGRNAAIDGFGDRSPYTYGSSEDVAWTNGYKDALEYYSDWSRDTDIYDDES